MFICPYKEVRNCKTKASCVLQKHSNLELPHDNINFYAKELLSLLLKYITSSYRLLVKEQQYKYTHLRGPATAKNILLIVTHPLHQIHCPFVALRRNILPGGRCGWRWNDDVYGGGSRHDNVEMEKRAEG